ncbi:MAG TPA: hypothetical protein VLV31_02630, partial [Candidatus Acidoferrales bacterium]|nr:hypothetical protein [Candidatus Acidoferrales bacterium]
MHVSWLATVYFLLGEDGKGRFWRLVLQPTRVQLIESDSVRELTGKEPVKAYASSKPAVDQYSLL